MRTLGMYLPGTAAEIRDADGTPVEDNDFLLVLNAHHEPVEFKLGGELGDDWTVAFDTAVPDLDPGSRKMENPALAMEGRSMAVLRRTRPNQS